MPLPALYAIAIAVILGIGFAGGFSLSSKIADGKLARCELHGQEMIAAHEKESNRRMQAAAESSDQAMAYVMNRMIDAEQQAGELRNEAKTFTSGRDCLSGGARRVLEQSEAFKQRRVPESARGADSAAAGAAADPGDGNQYTTDTDMADWIATVGSLYEQCRNRVDAVRQWDDGLSDDGRH